VDSAAFIFVRTANVEGTRSVADACKRHDAKMVFISTDYIFFNKVKKDI